MRLFIRYDEAKYAYSQALTMEPDYFNALKAMALIFSYELPDYQRAETFYNLAMKVEPEDDSLYFQVTNQCFFVTSSLRQQFFIFEFIFFLVWTNFSKTRKK